MKRYETGITADWETNRSDEPLSVQNPNYQVYKVCGQHIMTSRIESVPEG